MTTVHDNRVRGSRDFPPSSSAPRLLSHDKPTGASSANEAESPTNNGNSVNIHHQEGSPNLKQGSSEDQINADLLDEKEVCLLNTH